ncbi:MAG: Lrp/AsnC family transcriptional regulator [Candidatus Nanopelagicales bacterium]
MALDDDIDRKILMLLQHDGRIAFSDIAKETGLSTSALHQRVKRLESKGVITNYVAKVSAREVGLPLTAFISLTPLDPAAPDNVAEAVAEIPEVEGCWSVAGAESYILKVRVSEPIDLEELLATIRTAANVSTRTTVVLSTAFEDRPLALD